MKLIRQDLALAALAAGLVSAASAAVETYAIDPVHSSVGFSVRHFLTKVPGHFTKFTGTITSTATTLRTARSWPTIDVGSVSTDNEKRDNHLKSPDFFDAAEVRHDHVQEHVVEEDRRQARST
jgi:polyisoprenoid-binding protein YceI